MYNHNSIYSCVLAHIVYFYFKCIFMFVLGGEFSSKNSSGIVYPYLLMVANKPFVI